MHYVDIQPSELPAETDLTRFERSVTTDVHPLMNNPECSEVEGLHGHHPDVSPVADMHADLGRHREVHTRRAPQQHDHG